MTRRRGSLVAGTTLCAATTEGQGAVDVSTREKREGSEK